MTEVQVALDAPDLRDATLLAERLVEGGVRRVEAGHLLIKVAGLRAVVELRRAVEGAYLVADMKTMDTGADEVRAAAAAGADAVMVCAAASNATLEAAVSAGGEEGVDVLASSMGVREPLLRMRALVAIGDFSWLVLHKGIDEKFDWLDAEHGALSAAVAREIPRPAIGGSVGASNARRLAALGFGLLIVGRAVTAAPDPVGSARELFPNLRM